MNIAAAIAGGIAMAVTAGGPLPAASEERPPWTLPAPDYGGATALNVDQWYDWTDYPPDSVRRGEQGYVVIRYTITAAGRVADCTVTRSSGFTRLDAVPCRLIQRRARFRPALDENRSPRATMASSAMQFWMPSGG